MKRDVNILYEATNIIVKSLLEVREKNSLHRISKFGGASRIRFTGYFHRLKETSVAYWK